MSSRYGNGPAAPRDAAPDADDSSGRALVLRSAPVPAGTDDNTPGAVLAERDKPLTPSEEAYARKLVLYRNATRAFTEVYDCTRMKRESIWQLSCRIKSQPNVQRRIHEIESIAAAALNIDVQSLLAHDYAIIRAASAAPELSRLIWECCRYCHGSLNRYQWIDETEYARECVKVMDDNADRAERKQRISPMPSCDGGYGFIASADPNPECPQCNGLGQSRAVFADTRTLSGDAAILYRGVKQTNSGTELLTHDIDKAKDRIFRATGLYGDDAASVARAAAAGSAAGAAASRAAAIRDDMTPEQAARVYLELAQ